MTSIDYSRLRGLTARKLITALKKEGFSLVHQRGSHQIYRHVDKRRVTVSFHKGDQTFRPKILKIMLEDQAKWTVEDLKRLKIFK